MARPYQRTWHSEFYRVCLRSEVPVENISEPGMSIKSWWTRSHGTEAFSPPRFIITSRAGLYIAPRNILLIVYRLKIDIICTCVILNSLLTRASCSPIWIRDSGPGRLARENQCQEALEQPRQLRRHRTQRRENRPHLLERRHCVIFVVFL